MKTYFKFIINEEFMFFSLSLYRSDNNTSSHHIRTRHAPIVSIDVDDGGRGGGGGGGIGVGLIDDDLQALLPASHGISRDDLSQVGFFVSFY